MSYVEVPDHEYHLQHILAWNQWDRIWLAQLLLHLLTFIPEDATVTFFEQDKSISATLMRGITGWLQDQGVQGKQKNSHEVRCVKKDLLNAEINEKGRVQIHVSTV